MGVTQPCLPVTVPAAIRTQAGSTSRLQLEVEGLLPVAPRLSHRMHGGGAGRPAAVREHWVWGEGADLCQALRLRKWLG
jgi:hypothetical protein